MDRRTFVKGSAAVVGASTLAAGRVYAQAAAPDKIRFGYAITQSGPLGRSRGDRVPNGKARNTSGTRNSRWIERWSLGSNTPYPAV